MMAHCTSFFHFFSVTFKGMETEGKQTNNSANSLRVMRTRGDAPIYSRCFDDDEREKIERHADVRFCQGTAKSPGGPRAIIAYQGVMIEHELFIVSS